MDSKDNQIRELQKQVRALQRNTRGEKPDDESWSEYCEKSLKDLDSFREILEVVSKISEQCSSVLPQKLVNAFESCRGNKWPIDVRPCIRYNTSACEKGFCHWDRNHNKTNQKWIHICLVSNGGFFFSPNYAYYAC